MVELAQLFEEVEGHVEVEFITLIVKMDVLNTSVTHIGLLDVIPSNAVDDFSLVAKFIPEGIEEELSLLAELLLASNVESGQGFGVKLLGERHLVTDI
jgi:hypothetical protein